MMKIIFLKCLNENTSGCITLFLSFYNIKYLLMCKAFVIFFREQNVDQKMFGKLPQKTVKIVLHKPRDDQYKQQKLHS